MSNGHRTRTHLPLRRYWRRNDVVADAQPPLLMTVAEAEHALHVSRWTIYQLMRTGQLASVKIAGRRLIPAAAVTELVSNLLSRGSRL